MTDLKLRDALAERLETELLGIGFALTAAEMRSVASRLLESVPGEKELAWDLFSAKIPLTLQESERVARFLRQHIAGWVE